MAFNNLYSSNGGIYVRPSGLPEYYPVPGFSHGCKSLSPSASLTIHSCNSYKPSTQTMTPLSSLQISHQPSNVMSSYDNAMLNSHQTSSFAAALRKLAKQAGEPHSTEDSLLSTNSIANQSAVMSQMYLNNQQGAFSNNFSPSITSTSLPYYNGESKKGIQTSAFSLAITNNNQLSDSLKVKYGSLSHPLSTRKWEEHFIGTKELTSSAQMTTTVSIPSTTATENVSGRGFQPYRLMEERKHISSQFSLYDTPYAYSSNFISSPQVSSHTYRLEDAFYLEHYGFLRTPMMHIPSAQNLIPNPHTAFYHTGTYSSELLTQHMKHSSANILFEQERLKKEQSIWTENKELTKIKEQEIDKIKLPGIGNDLSPISFSKELSDKRRDSNSNDISVQNQENKTSMYSGNHSALLNFAARPKLESKQNTSHFNYSGVSVFEETDYSYSEQFENKAVELSNENISLSNLQNVKNTKSCINSNYNQDNNNSSFSVYNKNELILHCKKNYEESANVVEECNSPDKSLIEEQKYNINKEVIPNILEKKLQSLKLTNFVNRLQIPSTNCVQNKDNYQICEQYSKIISKLDLKEWKLKSKNDDCNNETDSEEEKKYNFLQIVLKGPPLPLDISPKKLKFLKKFNLITEKQKREIEFEKFLARREKLRETCINPTIEIEMETESKDRISSYCNYFVPILVDKTTFMKVLNLYPIIDGSNEFGLKKIERTVLDDAILQNCMLNSTDLYDKESTIRGIPLVHSTHLYKNYFSHSDLFSADATSSVKLDSSSKCSKRHRYSKLWIPKHKKQKVKTDRNLLGRCENRQNAKAWKSLQLENMELVNYTKEKSHASVDYHWPGIDTLMESYMLYIAERNLEQEILEERCHSLKIQNRWLSAKLEKKKNCMMKLMEKKKWLEKKNKIHKAAIDNLKRYLKELR